MINDISNSRPVDYTALNGGGNEPRNICRDGVVAHLNEGLSCVNQRDKIKK